jgi:uncharacterized membrane-anchored protein YhcB (DUF1043 family)
MVVHFFTSLIVVGLFGIVIIYFCKSSKKKLEEELKVQVERLDTEYREQKISNSDRISRLREKLDKLRREYSKSKKSNNIS